MTKTIEISSQEYSSLLIKYGVEFKETGNWLEIGRHEFDKNWVLFISIQARQMEALLTTILPVLIRMGIPFKFIKNELLHYKLNGGYNGSIEIGKVITIYPHSDQEVKELVTTLLPLTVSFCGPCLTDKCLRLGEVIYLAYSKTDQLTIDKHRPLPVKRPRQYRGHLKNHRIIGGYVPVKMLKYSPKGNVYKAYGLRGLRLKECLMKEGRAYMAEDYAGRDIRNRLEWEKEILENLSGILPVPQVFDYIQRKQADFLITEFITGIPFGDKITQLMDNCQWKTLSAEQRKNVLEYYRRAVGLIAKLHAEGYVHRDLNPDNLILSPGNQLYLIDFEISYPLGKIKTFPPFYYGMPGYAAPEQQHHDPPSFKEDIYSIGALLFCSLTGMPPDEFQKINGQRRKNILKNRLADKPREEMILQCLDHNPKVRPPIDQIQGYLTN